MRKREARKSEKRFDSNLAGKMGYVENELLLVVASIRFVNSRDVLAFAFVFFQFADVTFKEKAISYAVKFLFF
jgi:hypothetical protein